VHHRTVSNAPRESDSELASFGNPIRYNSPDCPVSHRTVSGAHQTVWCDSGATATSRATVASNALNARLRAQRSRARAGGTPDSLQGLSGAPPDSQAGPHVRAPTVGTQRPGDMAGAPDSVRWRTGLSGAPVDSSLHQTASLVVGAINTSTTPTFKSSKFFTFQLLTRAKHSIQDTPK
jgi:type II secretory pathway pseudopilin PulG